MSGMREVALWYGAVLILKQRENCLARAWKDWEGERVQIDRQQRRRDAPWSCWPI
jgi:hypothetical protein